jgi:hypothetical protein
LGNSLVNNNNTKLSTKQTKNNTTRFIILLSSVDDDAMLMSANVPTFQSNCCNLTGKVTEQEPDTNVSCYWHKEVGILCSDWKMCNTDIPTALQPIIINTITFISHFSLKMARTSFSGTLAN